ncbi:MAG TPA: CocE/NonD family hydrolase, partial [Burkholderiales bacterium]|nr:CocE/NonD family hydrolase [Burkholderiales bacterium]
MNECQSEVRDGMRIDWDVPITMDDGVVLRADVYRPVAEGKYPALVSHGPYGKGLAFQEGYRTAWEIMCRENPDAVAGTTNQYQAWEVVDPEKWVPDGYACVRVDSRGAGRSPGFLDHNNARENRDFHDCIEWAARQPWCSGKVGLNGISYYASSQWRAAALQPPHLAAMIPWEGMFDHYRDFYRHGGIYSSAFLKLLWDSQIAVNQNGNADTPYRDRFTGEPSTGEPIDPAVLAGNLQNVFEAGQKHPFDDAYFKARTPVAERIEVPFLSAGNWGGLGLHLRGNVIGYETAASRRKWLEMHTDTHFASMYLGEAVALQKRFFAHFLKGEANGFDEEPPVLLTIRDPRGLYRRNESEWPLARTQWTPMWLDAAKPALSSEAPAEQAHVSFEALGDGVNFWSVPFEEDTEFTGPVAAKLYVSSSTADMDIFLTLRCFDPSGGEVTFVGANDPKAPVSQGWLRASH